MGVFQAIMVVMLSSVKFLAAIPLAIYQYDFSFWETFLYSSLGGVFGVLIFSKLSKWIVKLYYYCHSSKIKQKPKRGVKKVVAIKIVRKYGLFGIAFLTPVFFSIPIGTFLALRFFPNKKKTLPVLLASIFGWSFVLSVVLSTL